MSKIITTCPKCKDERNVSEDAVGKLLRCRKCDHVYSVAKPDDREDDRSRGRRPRPLYQENNVLDSIAWLLIVGGALATTVGLLMETGILPESEDRRVLNFGSLARQVMMVLGGLTTVGLGVLVKVLSVVMAGVDFYQQVASAREGQKRPAE